LVLRAVEVGASSASPAPEVSTLAYSWTDCTQTWTFRTVSRGEGVHFCVQLGRVYAKMDICRLIWAATVRICVQFGKVYAIVDTS
jgi:hypothetical protein